MFREEKHGLFAFFLFLLYPACFALLYLMPQASLLSRWCSAWLSLSDLKACLLCSLLGQLRFETADR